MNLLPVLVLLALGATSPATPSASADRSGEARPAAARPGEDGRRRPLLAAENPRAADARFGLGLEFLADRLEGLEESASRTVVTLSGPDGSGERFVRPGDPDLTNRKFDMELDLQGVGLQVPIALPSFHLGGAVTVEPSLVLELAMVEADLDFVGRTEADAGSSLQGEGLRYGLGIGWVASACRRCGLFWGGGYRYRLLPDLDVERSPKIRPTHLQVLRDEVRLSGESHRFTGRLGYASAGGRWAPYVGFRYRADDLEVDDELRLLAPDLGEGTDLRTRTELDAEGVAGVLGVDLAWGRFVGRIEAAVGEDEVSALLKVVLPFAGAERPVPPTPTAPPPPVPPKPSVQALLDDGPRVFLGHRAVVVDGVVRGAWPVVVEAELPVDGVLRMEIEPEGRDPLRLDFPARAGEPISEIRDLPASLGDRLMAGRFTLRAFTDGEGEAIPFRFRGLGAGSGAIASLALEWTDFSVRPTTGEGEDNVTCAFLLVKKPGDWRGFAAAQADIFLSPEPGSRSWATIKDSGEIARSGEAGCLVDPKKECEAGLRAKEPGRYGLQVTAWRGDRRDGDWLAAVHPDLVEVEDPR